MSQSIPISDDNADQQRISQSGQPTVEDEDYVHWAYRVLLNTEPNPSLPSEFKRDRERLLRVILRSPEFRMRYVRSLGQYVRSPYSTWDDDAVAFIHLHKTGGTTFHSLLSAYFPSDRICPERFETLHLWTPSDLGNYDLFSGHFDYFSLNYIPRRHVRTVSIFRDPVKRQISLYRFAKSHSPEAFADDENYSLANELSPEEFFEHEHIIAQRWFNNTYLLAFGASLYDQPTLSAIVADTTNETDSSQQSVPKTNELVALALTRAKDRIASLDAIGLTERFAESMEVIFTTLGFPVPQSIDAQMVTNELPEDGGRYRRPPPVVMTPRLSRALERLTKFDKVLYDLARSEFERRRSPATQTTEGPA